MKRITALVGLCAAVLLAGCKDPQSGQPQNGLVSAGADVVIKSVHIYASTDNTPEAGQIYVVTFTFTNNLGSDFTPSFTHFVLEDQNKIRHPGTEAGSTVLVGISNYSGILKQGESHDYTLGFRVPINTSGLLFYDPT